MWANANVSDWMTTSVIVIPPDTPVSIAHHKMKEHGIRRLPVMDHDRLVGIVTIGDVREASPSDATSLTIWELNYLWAQLTVERVMTRNVITLKPDDTIFDAAQVMLDNKISGLPVMDADGKLLGIMTESDIFKVVVRSRDEIMQMMHVQSVLP
ncbi:MAG: CBS domain-containing protein [Chloroflexota bacterium]|nr:CBS domain-containing protein [Chloroflexota bacterium]